MELYISRSRTEHYTDLPMKREKAMSDIEKFQQIIDEWIAEEDIDS